MPRPVMVVVVIETCMRGSFFEWAAVDEAKNLDIEAGQIKFSM